MIVKQNTGIEFINSLFANVKTALAKTILVFHNENNPLSTCEYSATTKCHPVGILVELDPMPETVTVPNQPSSLLDDSDAEGFLTLINLLRFIGC